MRIEKITQPSPTRPTGHWFDYETLFLLQSNLCCQTDWIREEPYQQHWLRRVSPFNRVQSLQNASYWSSHCFCASKKGVRRHVRS